uniref:Uncharacterized protein n=1 Tax=Avena sativa TaxID=4498 RepID=A0ACD5ZX01_AVESA
MRDLRVNYVVITAGNSLRGILTSKDVLTRVIGHNRPPELTLVEKVMTLHPNCATLDATILDALCLMDSGKFLHIPVLNGDGMLVACLDVLQLLKLRDSTLEFEPLDEDHSLPYASSDRLDIKCMTPSVLELIMLEGSSEPTNLPFTLLQDITNNFSNERTIGYGGFGIVFKGVLQNGCVAVKKLFNSHTIEDGPFHREANFLMNVKHPNIVRFLGFCAHTEYKAIKSEGSGRYDKYIYVEMRERLLCFEYISKGSLDNHITDELRGLEWHARYQIIGGICEGLLYLHKEKDIVHMDLKPANILLNDLMVLKITDFGIIKTP